MWHYMFVNVIFRPPSGQIALCFYLNVAGCVTFMLLFLFGHFCLYVASESYVHLFSRKPSGHIALTYM